MATRKHAIWNLQRQNRMVTNGPCWEVSCPAHGVISHLTPAEAQRIATEHYDYCVKGSGTGEGD